MITNTVHFAVLSPSVFEGKKTGKIFSRKTQVEILCDKEMADQVTAYKSGDVRTVNGTFDRVDFHKYRGFTENGSSNPIDAGSEQILKNLKMHVMAQPFFSMGNEKDAISTETLIECIETYLTRLSSANLPPDVYLYSNNTTHSKLLRHQQREIEQRHGGSERRTSDRYCQRGGEYRRSGSVSERADFYSQGRGGGGFSQPGSGGGYTADRECIGGGGFRSSYDAQRSTGRSSYDNGGGDDRSRSLRDCLEPSYRRDEGEKWPVYDRTAFGPDVVLNRNRSFPSSFTSSTSSSFPSRHETGFFEEGKGSEKEVDGFFDPYTFDEEYEDDYSVGTS